MKVRKAKKNELNKVVKVADACFKPDRTQDFTFINSVPFIYNNKDKNFSDIHFIVEDENKEFLAIAGNLIRNIKINSVDYTFSQIGTVGTLPTERGKGYMKQLMSAIDKENLENKVVFSVLCGKRDRYENYGYERLGYRITYLFDKQQSRYLSSDKQLNIKKFKQSDLKEVFEIYKQKQIFCLRDIKDFEKILNNNKNKLFTIFYKNNIVGYLSSRKHTIIEINMLDETMIGVVINYILENNSNIIDFDLNSYNSQVISISATNLNIKLCKELDKICEEKQIRDSLMYKVYDITKFLTMLIMINAKIRKFNDSDETYKIDNKYYNLVIKGNRVKINSTSQTENYISFSSLTEFLRWVFGNDFDYNKSSNIFPVSFDINIADDF